MSAADLDCRHVRLAIGADPGHLAPEIEAHLAGCAACRRFRDETLSLDAKLRAALELPLPQFRRRASPVRRYALAASVVLALVVAAGAWVLRPADALAGEVVAHVEEEADSWNAHELMPASAISSVLNTAGVEFDSQLPVVYAAPCPFRGRRIAHLVVQTAHGPLTVMLLPHVHVTRREKFAEDGLHGLLLPAGTGSVAVLSRAAPIDAGDADSMVSAVRWVK
ncbi:MAG TPA: DUF3379 family protein [Steroidobacteraceae bacterium]|nr:DUF3379 family protein [Steroidobacteraceae bacterium]